MASNVVNLSLLSRGVGTVKKNGHEKIDVVLEPEDYFNWVEDPNRVYLPPLEPKYNSYMYSSKSSLKENHEVVLPKTFTTRKGALLLFSEDQARKAREAEARRRQERKMQHASLDDLDLKTVDDLSKSILAYGSHQNAGPVNLKFVYDTIQTPRKVRPGFSARRYLSRLTKSFDDSFLDKLLHKGYVHEKTLYQNNSLIPSLRRRINDDLSYLPAPYRIMKNMLMTPGLLSGYMFYKGEHSDLTMIQEDTELMSTVSEPIMVDIKDPTAEGDAPSVNYAELSKEAKGQVLADLLVKSAINHALEKQKQLIEDSLSKVAETNRMDYGSVDGGDVDSVHKTESSEAQPIQVPGLDIGEAVRSYLESALENNGAQDDSSHHSRSLRGSKVSIHSAKSFEANPHEPLPEIEKSAEQTDDDEAYKRKRNWPESGEREYVNGVPVVGLRETPTSDARSLSSSRQSSHAGQPPFIPANHESALSPIKDLDSAAASREATFNQNVVLPPILPPPIKEQVDVHLPNVNVTGPTPQHSNINFTDDQGETTPEGVQGESPEGRSSTVAENKEAEEHIDTQRGSSQSVLSDASKRSGKDEVSGDGISEKGDAALAKESASQSSSRKGFNKKDIPGQDSARQSRQSKSTASSVTARALSEQELVEALTDHAQKIAELVLSRPETGLDLGRDAQQIISELMSDRAASADPTVAEYKDLIKESLASVVSGSQASLLNDAEVSTQLLEALANTEITADDIEIVKDNEGQNVIRVKSAGSRASKGGSGTASRASAASAHSPGQEHQAGDETARSKPGSKPESKPNSASSKQLNRAMTGFSGFGIVNYGEGEKKEEKKTETIVRVPVEQERGSHPASAAGKSVKSSRISSVKGSEAGSVAAEDHRDELENMIKDNVSEKGSIKSGKSGKSRGSKKSEKKEEFVVGKVENKKELEDLYGPKEDLLEIPQTGKAQSKSKPRSKSKDSSAKPDKKPPVPSTKSPRKKKKTKKAEPKAPPSEPETPKEPPKEPTPPPEDKIITPREEESPEPPSEKAESEDMEFIIVRDEFSDDEDEKKSVKSTKSQKSVKSHKSWRTQRSERSKAASIATTSDEDPGMDSDASSNTQLKMISSKDARAQKRAAQATKRREEVERKRKEREEQIKKEREQQELKEKMQREIEEERRRKEEERRLQRERDAEEKRRQEEEENARERRAKLEAEKEKKRKEEYQRKLAEMKKKQEEEDRLRKELEARLAIEEEERRKAEEELMARMEEEERIAYEKRRAEEEEMRKKMEELARIKREEDAAKAMEEARRLAEEMARKQAEMERRLAFNRSLQLESSGLAHSQEVTRAFVFSYYELLQWLGLEVPEFETWKASLKF